MLFIITLFFFFDISSGKNISYSLFWNGIPSNVSSNHLTNQNLCEGLPTCMCSTTGINALITCKGLKDIDKLLYFLKVNYAHTNINHVYISRSVIDHLPPKAFINLSIQKIFIRRSIVGNISEDAFQGIIGLVELRLDNFNLSTIPLSIGKLNNTLRAMWMEDGGLETIEQTLQNCSQMQSLSFRCNRISTIHYLAFLHMTNLNKLYLSNNTIKWLDPRTFNSLRQLKYVTLMGNYLQSTLRLFNNQRFSIQKLILTGNNISDIRKLARRPLYSLYFLYLGNNPLKIIKNDSLDNHLNLLVLDLAATQLTLIEAGAFKLMTRLLTLKIANNSLSYLDNNIFSNMNSLQYVDISDNHIETIDKIFQNTQQIRKIYVSGNQIHSIDQHCFQNAKFLKELFLTRNFLRHIEKDTFINNRMLEKLQLINNQIKYLEPDSFRGLYSLGDLALSHNALTTLNRSINNLPSLTLLDLSHNYLEFLDSSNFLNIPNLRTINVASNLLQSVEGAFVHLNNLHVLRLQHNHLETITRSSFLFPDRLKIVELYDNPLTCNCLLKWIVELIKERSVIVDGVRCRKPEWLNRKHLKKLSLQNVTQWPQDCPQGCICTCFPNSTDYYIGVYCASLRMTAVPNTLPSKTGYLDLSRNEIHSIPQLMVDNLTQLQYIFLDENNLTSIPDFSDVKLHTLTLANNHLTRFPVSRVDSPFLQYLTLSNNPWLCDCQTLIFSKWLLSKELADKSYNYKFGFSTKQVKAHCVGRTRNWLNLEGTYLGILPDGLVSVKDQTIDIRVAISTPNLRISFLLFVAGGKIVYTRYRMNIKIWMYSKGICSSLSCIKEEDLDEDKRFDAFVSYSSEDETFVVQKLVPMLESGDKPYHLCLHYRHFAPGSYVQDSIIQAVQLSKRIILVLSHNFLQSEWCRLEFKSAHHLVLEERLNRLIVVILGELPPKDEIDPEIKLYLETTTYLRWGEKNFWNKLNYVMPRTPCVVTEEERMRLLD